MSSKLSLQERAKIKHISEMAKERLIQILQGMNLELKYQKILNKRDASVQE